MVQELDNQLPQFDIKFVSKEDDIVAYLHYAPINKDQALTCSFIIEFDFEVTNLTSLKWLIENDVYEQDQSQAAHLSEKIEFLAKSLRNSVFGKDSTALQIGKLLQHDLPNTVVTVGLEQTLDWLPVELLSVTEKLTCLSTHSLAFSRYIVSDDHENDLAEEPKNSQLNKGNNEKTRLLIVISRPRGEEDIPFRSVAKNLAEILQQNTGSFDVQLLRPPTFNNFVDVINNANNENRPFDIVHFDGHGLVQESPFTKKKEGVLCFEGEQIQQQKLVSGKTLGKVLTNANVAMMTINACRSGYSGLQLNKSDAGENNQNIVFGSLASSLLVAGMTSVLAMGYNVRIDTARLIISNLYGLMANGFPASQAINEIRKNIRLDSKQDLSYQWMIPIVYERNAKAGILQQPAQETPLLPSETTTPSLHSNVVQIGEFEKLNRNRSFFLGYDEIFYKLERHYTFDNSVQLNGLAGSGKSALALEYANWLASTGGWQAGDSNKFKAIVIQLSQYTGLNALFDELCSALHLDLKDQDVDLSKLFLTAHFKNSFWVFDGFDEVFGERESDNAVWSSDAKEQLKHFITALNALGAKSLIVRRDNIGDDLQDTPYVRIQGLSAETRTELALNLKLDKSFANDFEFESTLDWTIGLPGLIHSLTLIAGSIDQIDADALRRGNLDSALLLTLCRANQINPNIHETKETFYITWILTHFRVQISENNLKIFSGLSKELLNINVCSKLSDLMAKHDAELKQGFFGSSSEQSFIDIHPLASFAFFSLFNGYCYQLALEHDPGNDRAFVQVHSRFKHPVINTFLVSSAFAAIPNKKLLFNSEANRENYIWTLNASIEFAHAEAAARIAKELKELLLFEDKKHHWKYYLSKLIEFAGLLKQSPDYEKQYSSFFIRFYELLGKEEACHSNLQLQTEMQNIELNIRLENFTTYDKENATGNKLEANQIFSALVKAGELEKAQNDPACTDKFEQAYTVANNHGDISRAANARLRLAKAYLHVDAIYDYEKYEKYAREAIELLTPINQFDQDLYCQAKNSLGHAIMEKLKHTSKDDALLQEAKACFLYAKSHCKESELTPSILCGLGNVENLTGNPLKACSHYVKSANGYLDTLRWHEAAQMFANAAQVIRSENLEQALEYLDMGLYALMKISPPPQSTIKWFNDFRNSIVPPDQ